MAGAGCVVAGQVRGMVITKQRMKQAALHAGAHNYWCRMIVVANSPFSDGGVIEWQA
jgi:hypothetical protein